MTGILKKEIAWEMLTSSLGKTNEETEKFILDLFSSKKVENFAEWTKERDMGKRVAICVSATHDYFVSQEDSLELYRSFVKILGEENTSMKWVHGGHCSTILKARYTFVPAIVEAFQKLKEISIE